MRIDIITIFPEMVEVPLSLSLIGRGRENGLFEISVHDLREFVEDKHRVVDDVPYGGGPGMVMKPEPIMEALKRIDPDNQALRIITSAAGEVFNQELAADFARREWIIIVCGHYKGVDQRAVPLANLREISIGDFILTGGEYASLVIADAVLRLLPGTMKDFESASEDSHFSGILGPEEFTRPEVYEGVRVPEVLVSGHHEKIRRWRLGNALHRTKQRRPDLFERKKLTKDENDILNEYETDQKKMEME
jgi:tRNA (guanine37-N1)-methyltransferase